MSQHSSYDVIVIGAGFAGATAARDLRRAGRSVLLLEARDRVGGRTWTRPFPGTQTDVELGGAYIVPTAQRFLNAELERYGIGTVDNPAPEAYAWDVGGEVTGGFPIPMEELPGFESTMYELMRNGHRIELGKPLPRELADLDISYMEFLERAGAGPKTLEFLGAFGDLGGAPAEEVSMIGVLCELAAVGNSPLGLFSAASAGIDGGTKRLIDAIIADTDADLRLQTPVSSVIQDDEGVTVATDSGESFTAPTAIVAIPSNCWEDIAFTPALSAPKQLLATEKHIGRVRKIWVLIDGAPDTFAMGRNPDAMTALLPGPALADRTLYAGFKVEGEDDLTDIEVVQKLIRRYLPDARVLAVDGHDWNADPYSKGAALVHRKGRALELIDAVQDGEGRVTFAGADVCAGWLGWIDGAIESGTTAATRTEALLSKEPRARV